MRPVFKIIIIYEIGFFIFWNFLYYSNPGVESWFKLENLTAAYTVLSTMALGFGFVYLVFITAKLTGMVKKINKEVMPVLPLRDVVVYPNMVIPLFVGRQKSIRSLENAMYENNKSILLLTQISADIDDPIDSELYKIGCSATILQLLKLPDGTMKVLVEGVSRQKVSKFIDTDEEIEKKITSKTKVISITHLSNVTGAILPVKEITELAHSKDIIVVVDGCQGAPHLRLDMQDLGCDFYAISCHKMYGPTGLGILYGKKKWLEELPPYQGGGGMINEVKKDGISYGDLPNKYEAGTMATAQVIAFDQSIKFLESIGIENIMKHEADLVEYGQELLQKNNSVKLIGNPKNKGGVLSFTIEGIHPHDVATILDEDGVAIRAGHHCCQILHDKLNIPASSRASVGIYNTREDLDTLNDAINNCKKIFNQK